MTDPGFGCDETSKPVSIIIAQAAGESNRMCCPQNGWSPKKGIMMFCQSDVGFNVPLDFPEQSWQYAWMANPFPGGLSPSSASDS
jgi:hypothetical protein